MRLSEQKHSILWRENRLSHGVKGCWLPSVWTQHSVWAAAARGKINHHWWSCWVEPGEATAGIRTSFCLYVSLRPRGDFVFFPIIFWWIIHRRKKKTCCVLVNIYLFKCHLCTQSRLHCAVHPRFCFLPAPGSWWWWCKGRRHLVCALQRWTDGRAALQAKK